jgi:hypothetical protein
VGTSRGELRHWPLLVFSIYLQHHSTTTRYLQTEALGLRHLHDDGHMYVFVFVVADGDTE